MIHAFHLVTAAALNSGNGYGYTSNWVDVGQYPYFSMSAVFTGSTPVGTLSLQQSNDTQWTGSSPVAPLWSKDASLVSDAANVPAGTGINTVAVSGAGVFVLNQFGVGYKWVRLVYVNNTSITTQLDVFMSMKSGG